MGPLQEALLIPTLRDFLQMEGNVACDMVVVRVGDDDGGCCFVFMTEPQNNDHHLFE